MKQRSVNAQRRWMEIHEYANPLMITKADDHYQVGTLSYRAENSKVIVTRDLPNGLIENVAFYEYKNEEIAKNMAWSMAIRQSKA